MINFNFEIKKTFVKNLYVINTEGAAFEEKENLIQKLYDMQKYKVLLHEYKKNLIYLEKIA